MSGASPSAATPALAISSVTLLSAGADRGQGDGNSEAAAISADGRYVAFESAADDLVAGDTNDATDIFLKDISTGRITRISISADGGQADGASTDPAISADGRYVAFSSLATNLVPADGNNREDVFVKDTRTGAIVRASTAGDGTEADGGNANPAISANGRYVAFTSGAGNLVPGDWGGYYNIYVKDTLTGGISRISVNAAGDQGDNGSHTPVISADGRYVAFSSLATNLVPEDDNNLADIFVSDTQNGKLTRVSTSAEGAEADADSANPAISADGRYVAFESYAANLVPGDGNKVQDVFVKDLQTGAIARVSTDSGGNEGNQASKKPAISADGRSVAFYSYATDLVSGDNNDKSDIFIKDTLAGNIIRVSTAADGTQGMGDSKDPSVSADGRSVAFESEAGNLTSDDGGSSIDVFLVTAGRP